MRRGIALAVFGLALFAPGALRAAEDELERRIEDLEGRIKEFSTELERLREEKKKEDAEKARVEEVERKQGILTEELRRVRDMLVLPETKEMKSAYGLGPAASKVYGIQKGLSIGGYGEFNFDNEVSDKTGADNFDYLRFVLYVGYKYNDWIVLNSEIEFEHGTTSANGNAGSGSVSVEFATLDFLLHPMANARFGMVLVPVGFLNEIHEPPFFHGNVRPQVEQLIIPSTWRANGFGLFGELLPGLEYRTYGITSLDAVGYTAGNGIRNARQNGNRERAHDWSWVARLDYAPIEPVLVGGSIYLGDQGQNRTYGDPDIRLAKADVFTQLYEIHAQVRTHGLELRALGTYIDVDDADILSLQTNRNDSLPEISGPIGDVMLGAYGEIAYDVLPLILPETTHYLAPWFRYSWFDTQNDVPDGFARSGAQRRDIYEVGLTYKPIPQVVFKLDYRSQDRDQGKLPDEIRVGAGFVY